VGAPMTQQDEERRPADNRSRRRQAAQVRTGTLGGSNRMLSSRDIAGLLGVPEVTVRAKWREWGLQAYRIGKHLRWREREVQAWVERQAIR
jgi:excisionase family DNA binding protein